MAPVFKLKYFDFMGLAEPIRYLFAYGSIKYVNIEISHNDWDDMQRFVPFGKLPVLEIDNSVLFQSVAISSYIAKLVGLVPADILEAAELEAISLSIYDYGTRVHEWFHEENEDRKEYLEKELIEHVHPTYLGELEAIVRKKGLYFGGSKLRWTDIYFVGIMESVEGMWKCSLLENKYPLLHQIFTSVHAIPAISRYIKSRPHYKY